MNNNKERGPYRSVLPTDKREEMELLVEGGVPFYDAIRDCFFGDQGERLKLSEQELADLTAFLSSLGESSAKFLSDSGDAPTWECMGRLSHLYNGWDREILEALPFVWMRREGRLNGDSCRSDWRYWVFNFLIAKGLPSQEARNWVKMINEYKRGGCYE